MAQWRSTRRKQRSEDGRRLVLVGLFLLCLVFLGKTFAGANVEHESELEYRGSDDDYYVGKERYSARNLFGEKGENRSRNRNASEEEEGFVATDSLTACSSEYIRKSEKSRRARCTYVRENCLSDGLLNYFEIYYCTALLPKGEDEEGSTVVNQVLFFAGMAVGLVVLFRVLGTTADDYFAPTLTELCREMGLPPRFAGVTFLALASGAPDVSSTFAAIRGGNYLLSLGALSGAAMFVTCVVSGTVIKVASGAKAKGALWRDMTMLMLTVGMVLWIFMKGTMHKSQAVLFIFMYFAFAIIVLIADLFHRRKVIVPAVVSGSRLVARRLSTIRRPSMASFAPQVVASRVGLLGGTSPQQNGLNTEMLPQHDMEDTDSDTESSDFDSKDGDWKYQNKKYKEDMLKAIENSDSDGDGGVSELHTGDRQDIESSCDYLPLVDGMETLNEPMSDKAMINVNEFFFQFYHKSHESMHAISRKMKQEGWKFFYEETLLNKVLIILEMPFTVARLVTIPAVDSDMYFKPFFVLSCIGVPWWILFNVGLEFGKLSITICVTASVVLGLFSHVLAPSKHPPMIKLGTKFPFGLAVICLVSFVLAALWINVVATELVSVISFIGNIAAIDESILGLTVIAWGNSIGDFSTNMAMAKRGLSNVSMTASFAGPVFNILVGLGFGFLYYFQYKGVTSVAVELNIVIALALVCIALNCLALLLSSLCNGFHIPKQAGYVSIGIYCVYIILGIICVATNTTLNTNS